MTAEDLYDKTREAAAASDYWMPPWSAISSDERGGWEARAAEESSKKKSVPVAEAPAKPTTKTKK